MSPTALDVPGHHDSFALPQVNDVKVHSSAKRSPEGGLITVESDDVVYESGEIRAKYTDRGAHVTSMSPCYTCVEDFTNGAEDANGRLHVKKTEKHYEFSTKSKVGKVG
jgi:myo-inositol-1-phosphate synthase